MAERLQRLGRLGQTRPALSHPRQQLVRRDLRHRGDPGHRRSRAHSDRRRHGKGADLVAANIGALGFRLEDVKVLLQSHVHFDHVGGLAELQRRSGAKLIASPEAAPVMASGETAANDPQFGMHSRSPRRVSTQCSMTT